MRLGDGRYDLDALLNQEIVFRNTRGQIVNIPIKSVVKSKNPTVYSTFGSVVRKDVEDVVTVFSKVKHEDQAGAVVEDIKKIMEDF